MKTTRTILVCLLVVLCLMVSAFADVGYTAALDCENSTLRIGDAVTISVSVVRTGDTVFSSSELIISYDSSKLSFVSLMGTGNGGTVDSSVPGTLTVEDCGADKVLGDGAYVLNFTAIAQGETSVTLNSAAFSSKEHAETGDLIPADVSDATVSVDVLTTYSVTLPDEDYVSGEDKVGEGQDYTLTVADYEHYDYEVRAAMGGKPVDLLDNGDGTYTVENVSGALVFTVSRSGKQYAVHFQTDDDVELPEDTNATYGEDFRFKIPVRDGYATELVITYDDGSKVPYSTKDGYAVIAGDKITDKITVAVKQTEIVPTPSPSPTPTKPTDGDRVKTGDEAMPILWLGIMLLGVAGVVTCIKKKKQ